MCGKGAQQQRLPGNFQNSFNISDSSAALRMAVDPILEVDEKVVEEVPQKCDEKNQEPETPEKKKEEGGCEVPASPDPYYPPIIYLPEVVVNSGEEEEEEAFRRRAKLYRLDLDPNISILFVVYQLSILSEAQLFCSRYAHEEEPAEWKERGTGEVELTYHHHIHFHFPRYPYQ